MHERNACMYTYVCMCMRAVDQRIFAIGGYDGTQYQRTVEVLDTRMGGWNMAAPLRVARAYMGAAVI